MKNWRSLDYWLSLDGLAWLMSFMLLFWSPFYGEQRVPALVLLLVGLWLQVRHPGRLAELPGIRQLRWLLGLLLVASLASLPLSLDMDSTLRVLGLIILLYWIGIAMLAGLSSLPIRILTYAIGLTFAIWAIDGLWQFATGSDLLGIPLRHDGRVVGLFGDNQRLGVTLGVMMPIILFPLSLRRPMLALTFFLVLTFVIGLVGTRASLVFALLAGLGLLFRIPRRHGLLLLLTLLVMSVAVTYLSPPLKTRLLERDYTPYTQIQTYQDSDALFTQVDQFLSGRLKIWETGLHMFMDRPLVGIGAGAFAPAYDRYATRQDDQFRRDLGGPGVYHAHQLYVAMAAETGLIGLACLGALFWVSARWYRSLPDPGRKRAWPYAYSLGIAFFPINSQHPLFIGWWFGLLFLAFCAMLVAGQEGRETDR